MQDSAFNRILTQISRASHVSASDLRAKMQLAMEAAMANPDPVVQDMWRSIPKKGEKPTLEEFMEYLIDKNLLSP